MRELNGPYERSLARAARLAQPIVDRIKAGETVTYDDAADLDDAAWQQVRDITEEVPGVGYRLRQSR